MFVVTSPSDCIAAQKKVISKNKEKIITKVDVKEGSGFRVFFTGKNNEFFLKKDGTKVYLTFKQNGIVSNTSEFNKAQSVITSFKVNKNKLFLQLKNEQVEVSQFQLKGDTGLEIKLKEESQEEVKSAVIKESETADVVNTESEAKQEKKVPVKQGELVISSAKDSNYSTITFAWPKYVAASAFVRGSKIWVVFNDQATTSFHNSISDSVFGNIKQEESSIGSIFTLDLKNSEEKPNIIMYRDGFNWFLEFSKTNIKPKDVRILSRPLAAPQPRVEIELEEVALEPIRINDEYVGDSFVIIPFIDGGVAVAEKFTFVDFTIPKTVQGAVVIPKSDTLKVRNEGFLIKIEGAAGLNIAPRVLKKQESKFEQSDQKFQMDEFIDDYLSILSIKTFQVTDEKYLETVSQIYNALEKSKTPEKHSKVLGNWALFNLANGLYKEGLVVIKLLKKEDPQFGNTYNVKLIEAVLNFMDGNYTTAYDVVKRISIVDVPLTLRREVRFWQAIIGYSVSGSDDFLTRLDPMSLFSEKSVNFLSDYNDKVIYEIITSIVLEKIKDRSYSDVSSLLKMLNDLKVPVHEQNYIHAITAEYYAALDKQEEALKEWDKCIEDINDLKNRTYCRYKKANFEYYTKRIKYKEYVDELEGIAASWHGDQFEIDVLSTLGDKYVENKDYINALRSWDKIVTYYPFTPDSLRLSKKMSDTFVNFFTENKDEQLSHLQALALFYEFDKLVPIGDVGDDVVTKFTDHLIALDLLDRASALLNHQIKNRLNGNRREKAINKLAKIYLQNSEPVYAVDIIKTGESYITLPDDIAKERRYIHAVALHQNHEDTKALKLLKGDYSQQADEIKAEIYWSVQDWKNFNDSIEPRIYRIRDAEQKLTPDEMESVLKLAISYSTTYDWKLLGDLYKDFKPRVPEDDRNGKIFLTLENAWEAVKQNSLEANKSIALIQDVVSSLVTELNPSIANSTPTPK